MDTKIDSVEAYAYAIPTEKKECDGTLCWSKTTAVVVEVRTGAGTKGVGYTYTAPAAARLVEEELGDLVVGSDALDVAQQWQAMVDSVRNMGRPGLVSMAIAAVDCALWDLKGRILGLPLARLLGQVHEEIAVYGSGGFTSQTIEELVRQTGDWVHKEKIPMVKIKIGSGRGTDTAADLTRIEAVRKEIGEGAQLFVDANGAYGRKQAVSLGRPLADLGVSWFEEPVSSDDLDGLRAVRDSVDMEVTAGEYGHDAMYFERMCGARAVDVAQIDVTRCAGISEFRRAAAVVGSHGLSVSGHCGPSMHLHPMCSLSNARHTEYFADHVRVEGLLFDGAARQSGGKLRPDLSRPGNGLELKKTDVERWRVKP